MSNNATNQIFTLIMTMMMMNSFLISPSLLYVVCVHQRMKLYLLDINPNKHNRFQFHIKKFLKNIDENHQQ